MKKVVSFCIFSVFMAVLCIGVKAQTPCCLQLNPLNLPSSIVVDSAYTFDLTANLGCLLDGDKIAIKWELLKDGDSIPDGELGTYLNEFRFQTQYNNHWFGEDYVSAYCDDRDGNGWYPGAFTPVYGQGQFCERTGNFNIINNEFDYFYVKFFKDASATAHRLIINFKEDGNYSLILSLYTRIGGTDNDGIYAKNDQTYHIGGHQSEEGALISSDTLYPTVFNNDTVTICIGNSYTAGRPDTTMDTPGDYTIYYYGTSFCGEAIDSIIYLHLIVEDPNIAVLDTLNCSNLIVCDADTVTLAFKPDTTANTCIWLNGEKDSVWTGVTFEPYVTSDTTFYAVSFNSTSGCVSGDTLSVSVQRKENPAPVITPTTVTICEEQDFTLTTTTFDRWAWFKAGETDTLSSTDTYSVTNATTAHSGQYLVIVEQDYTNAIYPTDPVTTCFGTDTVPVTVNALPTVTVNNRDEEVCAKSTLNLGVTTTGSSLSYAWTGGDLSLLSDAAIENPVFSAPAVTSDTTYTYYITVTDGTTGCISHPDTVNILVRALPVLTISAQCYNDGGVNTDSITFGGADSYDLYINNVLYQTYTVAATDTTVGFTIDYTNPGTIEYFVIGTDEHGCFDTSSIASVTIDTVVFSYTDSSFCAGTVTTFPTTSVGGTWEPATLDYNTVGEQYYVFTPTNACERIDSIKVTVWQNPVLDSIIASPVDTLICPNQHEVTLTAYASNGQAPYTYNWVDSTSVHTQTLTISFAGTVCNYSYTNTVSVVDSNGCSSNTVSNTFIVRDTAHPVITRQTDTIVEPRSYYNGSCSYLVPNVIDTIINSVPNIQATSSCGEGVITYTQDPVAGSVISTTTDVVVTATTSCDSIATTIVTVQVPLPVELGAYVSKEVLCPGDSTGEIKAYVINETGSTDYTYTLYLGGVFQKEITMTNTDTAVFEHLLAETYEVRVSDGNGCTDTVENLSVTSPAALTMTVSDIVDVQCYGYNNGHFTLNCHGGTTPYILTIDTNGTNYEAFAAIGELTDSIFSDLGPNKYVISLEDAHNCVRMDSVQINQPDTLVALGLKLNDVACFGDNSGNATVVVTGGNGGYTYSWKDTLSTPTEYSTDSITGRILPAGMYVITVTDSKNCVDTSSVVINQPEALTAVFDTVPVNPCPFLGSTTGYTVETTVTGGVAPYTYEWNSVVGTDEITFTTDDTCNRVYDVHLKVTDDSGCVVVMDTSFKLIDNEIPVITGTLRDTLVDGCTDNDTTSSINTLASLIDLANPGFSVSDNCTENADLVVTHVDDPVATDTACRLKVIRTYYVTDKCGNTASVSQTIQIQDTVAPVFEVNDTTVYMDMYCTVVTTWPTITGPYNVSDNCTDSAQLNISFVDSPEVQDGCASSYHFDRTWTITDQCLGRTTANNTTIKVQRITVVDTIAPIWDTRAGDLTKQCDGAGNITDLNNWLNSWSASDNCSTVTVTNDYDRSHRDSSSCDNNGNTFTVEVIFTAEDLCGNKLYDTASFTVIDTIAPVFTNVAADDYMECDAVGFNTRFGNWMDQVTGMDACNSDYTLTRDTLLTTALDCAAEGRVKETYRIIWTLSDGCNLTKDTAYFKIQDKTVPSFEAGRPAGERTVYASCSTDTNRKILKEWLNLPYAIDACTDSATLNATMVITGVDTNTLLADGIHFDGWIPDPARPTNCRGRYHIIWTVTDECGNMGNTEESFWIEDTIGPYWVVAPKDTTVSCDEDVVALYTAWKARPQAMDDCTGEVASLVYEEIHWYNDCNNTNPFGSGAGHMVGKFTATDSCGNIRVAQATFYVKDTIAPVALDVNGAVDTLLNDTIYKKINAIGACIDERAIHQPATFNDLIGLDKGIINVEDCDITLSATVHTEIFDLGSISPCINVFRAEMTYKDECGNWDTLSQHIYVIDTLAPKLVNTDVLHKNITITTPTCHIASDTFLSLNQLQAEFPTFKVFDCKLDTGSLVLTSVDQVDTCPMTITHHYSISDSCGLTSSFDFIYYAYDNQSPVISGTLPLDTVDQDGSSCTADLTVFDPDFLNVGALKAAYPALVITDCRMDDTCHVDPVLPHDTTYEHCYMVIARHFTITDDCGNVSDQFTHTVVVRDVTDPVVSPLAHLSNDTIKMTDPTECLGVVPTAFSTVQDLIDHGFTWADITDCNVGPTSPVEKTYEDTADVSCYRLVTRRYILKDSCDNISNEFEHLIYFADSTAPVITGTLAAIDTFLNELCEWPTDLHLLATDYASLSALDGTLTVSDCNIAATSPVNCAIERIDTVKTGCNRKLTIPYTLQDECGNESDTFYFVINVLDTIAPQVLLTTIPDSNLNFNGCDLTDNYPKYATVQDVLDVTGWTLDAFVKDCNVAANSVVELEHADTIPNPAAHNCHPKIVRYYYVVDSCNDKHSNLFSQTINFNDTVVPVVSGSIDTLDLILGNAPDCNLPTVDTFKTIRQALEYTLSTNTLNITDCNLDTDDVASIELLPAVPADTISTGCVTIYVRHYLVSDSCGNQNIEDTIHHIIRVTDTIGPRFDYLTDHSDAGTLDIDLDESTCTSAVQDTFQTAADALAFSAANGGNFAYFDCNATDASIVTLHHVDTLPQTLACTRNVIRYYTMTDDCGNVSDTFFTQKFRIVDVTAPQVSVTTLHDTVIYNTPANCDPDPEVEIPAYATIADLLADHGSYLTITDCNLWKLENSLGTREAADCPNLYEYTRTYTVFDSCGHTSTLTQVIFVRDTFAPELAVSEFYDTTYFDNCNIPTLATYSNITDFQVEYPTFSATDCNDINPVLTIESIERMKVTACDSAVVYTYSFTDSCNFKTQFTLTYTIRDTLKPVVTGVLNTLTIYFDSLGNYSTDSAATYTSIAELVANGITSVTDCNLDSVLYDVTNSALHDNRLDCADNYFTRTYTVKDSCSRDTTISQRIEVRDTIRPWLNATIDTVAATPDGSCKYLVPDFTDTIKNHFVDNRCDSASYISQPTYPAMQLGDTLVVPVTFRDSCNNESIVNIVVLAPAKLSVGDSVVTNLNCHNDFSGKIVAGELTGGIAPYTYELSGDATRPAQDTVTFDNLAAGTYTITARDASGCEVTVTDIVITEPDTLIARIAYENLDTCYLAAPLTLAADFDAANTRGTAPYSFGWQFESEVLSTTDSIIVRTDTIGSWQYVLTITDSKGCVSTDTVTSVVHPTYFHADTGRVCFDSTYFWVGHDTITPVLDLPANDSTYILWDSLRTVDCGCDSVFMLVLRVENTPYLVVRRLGEGESQLRERNLDSVDVFNTGVVNNTVGYEIFVKKNCMQCPSENLRVFIRYRIYKKNGDTWDLLTNDVSNYFTPNYRTYQDMYNLNMKYSPNGTVTIPSIYDNLGSGTGQHFDYYYLCWTSPGYNPARPLSTFATGSGTPYLYGRANTITFGQFITAGEFKIEADLVHYISAGADWGYSGYDECGLIGGHGSITSIDTFVYSTVAMEFKIQGSPSPVMPNFIDPMEGIISAPFFNSAPAPVVNLYPNPARDFVDISIDGFEGSTAVTLSNSDGATLDRVNLNIQPGAGTQIVRIPTTTYSQGIYMVTIRDNSSVVTKRVVIIR